MPQLPTGPFGRLESVKLSNARNPKVLEPATDISSMNSITSVSPFVSLPSALGSGLATITSGNQQLNQDAEQIANLNDDNLTDSLLDLTQASLLAQVGADVIRTSNAMLGTLIDVSA
jgi:hypothetical protein